MKYLIWSLEHKQWWKSNSNGYTNDINKAGRYDFNEANNICKNANIKEINEMMFPIIMEGKNK